MANRFRTSKFRHASVRQGKRDHWYADTCTDALSTDANHIKASCEYVACTWNTGPTGSIAILPIDTPSKLGRVAPLIRAHTDFISDFDFSPFHDGLLASGSNDTTVKLWRIPDGGIDDSLSAPHATFDAFAKRIEWLKFHPQADHILAIAEGKSVHVADVSVGAVSMSLEGHHGDNVFCMDWSNSGRELVTTCKDKKVRLFDVRSNALAATAESHKGTKTSRVQWLGDHGSFVTTGFGRMREREYALWDARSLDKPLHSVQLDSSTGCLIPVFDRDTNMLFIGGKGDSTIRYLEYAPEKPFFFDGASHVGDTPQTGLCRVPKRKMDVMNCEVVRLLKLTRQNIVPVSWDVPRKSMLDFHDDLFPDTNGGEAALSGADWLAGGDGVVAKVSLDPRKRGQQGKSGGSGGSGGGGASNSGNASVSGAGPSPIKKMSKLSQRAAEKKASEVAQTSPTTAKEVEVETKEPAKAEAVVLPKHEEPVFASSSAVFSGLDDDEEEEEEEAKQEGKGKQQQEEKPVAQTEGPAIAKAEPAPTSPPAPVSTPELKKVAAPKTSASPKPNASVVRASFFRHVFAKEMHRSQSYESLSRVSQALSGETNAIEANPHFLAFGAQGPGGLVCVLETGAPRRLDVGNLPCVQCGVPVLDIKWDPFDNGILACACEDGVVRIFQIPGDGLDDTDPLEQCYVDFNAHDGRVNLLLFHPLAKDILVSSASDHTVRMWNLLNPDQPVREFFGHNDQVLGMCFNYDGSMLATVCKDRSLRVFDALDGSLLTESVVFEGKRGARVTWAGNSSRVIISCFDRSSARQLKLIDATSGTVLGEATLDVAPAVLIPHFDEDTSVVFAFSRGGGSVALFEVDDEAPYLHSLTQCKLANSVIGLAPLPKSVCDVREVELLRMVQLCKTSVVKVQFFVPRTRKEVFQDDVLPPTRCRWDPSMQADDFLAGELQPLEWVDMCPDGMMRLSEAPQVAVKESKYAHVKIEEYKSDEQKKAELVEAMAKKMGGREDEPLEQDTFDGVDEDEWSD